MLASIMDARADCLPRVGAAIPAAAGIGLRAPHYRDVLKSRPAVGWLEVHSENYFGDGGQPLFHLEKIRAHYPLSLHGVGLSLGSADPLNRTHLQKLKTLITRVEPGFVSDHLCWGSIGARYSNDLLPLPYTEEALDHVAARILEAQDFLGRQMLIENVSSYLEYRHSTIAEWDFLAEIARRSGCGILLDVNNIYVSARNHGFDAMRYLTAIPIEAVQEIHLAGFDSNGECLIDTHGKPVFDEVWRLFEAAIARVGPRPTLIEWDTDIPALAVLLEEARKAQTILEKHGATGRATARVPAAHL
jgi:uncharacterized protein